MRFELGRLLCSLTTTCMYVVLLIRGWLHNTILLRVPVSTLAGPLRVNVVSYLVVMELEKNGHLQMINF